MTTVANIVAGDGYYDRAENTLRTMVAMCWSGNLGPPTKLQRQAIRAYLEEVTHV